MGLSDAYRDKILNQTLRGTSFPVVATAWMSLHSAAPGNSGTAGHVAVAWMPIEFNAPASSTCINATTVDFAAMPATTVTHVGLWDSSATGTATHIWNGQIYGADGSATSKVTNSGDTLRFTSGNIRVTLTS